MNGLQIIAERIAGEWATAHGTLTGPREASLVEHVLTRPSPPAMEEAMGAQPNAHIVWLCGRCVARMLRPQDNGDRLCKSCGTLYDHAGRPRGPRRWAPS